MFIDFEQLDAASAYKLIAGTVVPRPIALVTTRNPDGGTNAGPYSFFNAFSEDPPLVVLGLGSRPDDTMKDSTVNIRRTGEFVVNMVDESILPAMVDCACDLPPGESEIPYTGLTLEKSSKIDVDRIVEAPVSFACRKVTVLQFGRGRDLAVGEILGLCARPGIIDPDTLRVDPEAYRPVGRLYGTRYARLGETISLPVPEPKELRSKSAHEQKDKTR